MRLRPLTALVLCLATFSARAATEINAVLWITNTPAGLTSNLTVNIGAANTRYSTNATAGVEANHWAVTNTIAWARSNLYAHLAAYPVYSAGAGSPQLGIAYTATNTAALTLTAPENTNLTATVGGNWAFVTYFTNTFTDSAPILNRTNALSMRERTNAANAIVNYLAAIATSNAIPANTRALSNYLDLSTSQTASNKTFTHSILTGGRAVALTNLVATNLVATNVTLHLATITGGNLSGTINALTNGTLWSNTVDSARVTNVVGLHGSLTLLQHGVLTNARLDRAFSTNLANHGNPITSPNASYVGVTEQFGHDAIAQGTEATALSGSAFGSQALAIGGFASNNFATAIGYGSSASASISAAFGYSSQATNIQTMALGYFAIAGHSNSMAIGHFTTNTASDQIRFGSPAHTISIPGNVGIEGNLRDAHVVGTNTWTGDLSISAQSLTTVASGHNTIAITTNVYVEITGSPAGAWQLGAANFNAVTPREGHIVLLRNSTGQSAEILHNSGTEPTAAWRITTPTSTNVAWNSGASALLRYTASSARWILLGTYYQAPTAISANYTIDFPSIPAGSSFTTNFTLAGATTNDWVDLQFPPWAISAGTGMTNLAYQAWPSNDVVYVRAINGNTLIAADPASAVFRARIQRY